MAGYLQDLANVDVSLVGEFGAYTLRNYGEDGTSIEITSIDDNLYNEHVGAFGDILINKSYKPQNMLLKVKAMRHGADYARLKGIVSLELTGEAVIFAASYVNNSNNERVYSAQCFMKKNPPIAAGSDPSPDVEFQIIMTSVVYTPPTIA